MLSHKLDFMERVGRGIDAGHYDDATEIAVAVRTIVHDTDTSWSLLRQLGNKDGPRFVDSGLPLDPITRPKGGGVLTTTLNLMGSGLTAVEIYDDRMVWFAPLDDDGRELRHIHFDPWWTNEVMRGARGDMWTRKKLVLRLANKEGGAHVDSFNAAYEALADRMGVAKIKVVTEEGEPEFVNNPALAAVRQIAWELGQSLAPLVA